MLLLAINPDEDFIDVEGIAVASMAAFQTPRVNCAEFNAPEADGLASDDDAAFSEKVFDVSVAEIESIVEPDGVGNDIWRESVALVGIHPPILAIWAS